MVASDVLLLLRRLLGMLLWVQLSQVEVGILTQSPLLVPCWQGVRLGNLLTLGLKGVRILQLEAVVLHGPAALSGGQGMVSNQRSRHRCLTVTLKLQRDAYRGALLARICPNNVDFFDQTLTLPTASIPVSNAVGAHL